MVNNLSNTGKETQEGGANQNFLFVALFLFILIFFIILVTLNIGEGENSAGSFIKNLKLHNSSKPQESQFLTANQQKILMYKNKYWDRVEPILSSRSNLQISDVNVNNPENLKVANLLLNKQEFLQKEVNISNDSRETIEILSNNQNLIEDIPLKFSVIYPTNTKLSNDDKKLLENLTRYFAYLGSDSSFVFSAASNLDGDKIYIQLSILK